MNANATPLLAETVVVTRSFKHGTVLVSFDCRSGSLIVEMTPPAREVRWVFVPGAGLDLLDGADIEWRRGRLIGNGPGARTFLRIKGQLGLSFGAIEAELRELTGYREGTE
jgi:hypothetical protein